MPGWRDSLAVYVRWLHACGERPQRAPADAATRSAFIAQAHALGKHVPADYLEYARIMDGMCDLGRSIYAIGPVAPRAGVLNFGWVNVALDVYPRRTYYGDDGLISYLHDADIGLYWFADRASGTLVEPFETFEALLNRVLGDMAREVAEDAP